MILFRLKIVGQHEHRVTVNYFNRRIIAFSAAFGYGFFREKKSIFKALTTWYYQCVKILYSGSSGDFVPVLVTYVDAAAAFIHESHESRPTTARLVSSRPFLRRSRSFAPNVLDSRANCAPVGPVHTHTRGSLHIFVSTLAHYCAIS